MINKNLSKEYIVEVTFKVTIPMLQRQICYQDLAKYVGIRPDNLLRILNCKYAPSADLFCRLKYAVINMPNPKK